MYPHNDFYVLDMVPKYLPHRCIKEMHQDGLVPAAGKHLMQHLLGTGDSIDIFKFMIRDSFVGAQSEYVATHRARLIRSHARMDKSIAVQIVV